MMLLAEVPYHRNRIAAPPSCHKTRFCDQAAMATLARHMVIMNDKSDCFILL